MQAVKSERPRINDLLETDKIVITGISGRFPESENLEEFWKNLYNGVDMVTEDGRRWAPGTFDLPKRSGKLKELDKFDAGFFGVHPKQANVMDPQLRILMEVTYEAILDAGVNPTAIRGTRTGVFIGACTSESEKMWFKDNDCHRHGYTLTGCSRGMFSNRVSFAFDFHGPSFTVDTACSSSFITLEQAVTSIKAGHCDGAIVGGANLCLEPELSLQYNRLNMLSPEGKCKSFDADGNGYVRSEAVVAIFIQKKDVARRSYAQILAARTNSDGFKEQGVTFPSGKWQKALLEETYREAGVNPNDVVYVEAHGTGTPAGDPQELTTISQVLCKNRDQNNPLLIGSVKSNIGHAEPSSGLCGLAKVLLAMQNGTIPANLHFKNPNPNIAPLVDGRLKVVSQNTLWEGGIVGINSFGFGGANVHVIIKSEPKKQNPTKRNDENILPFVIPFSGCTKESVEFAMTKIRKDLIDKIHANANETGAAIALLHKMFQERNPKHNFRGFSLFHENGQPSMEISQVTAAKPPVWFIFNGMGSQWLGFAKELFKFSAFKESIEKSTDTLKNNQFDLQTILFTEDEKILEDVTNSFVIITAVQIALVDLLYSLGINPDGIVGHSVGELGAAYADGCLTLEQTILASLARGEAISESSSDQKYGMAAVGLSWDEVKSKCPPNVFPACHNSKDSVTISGPLDDIKTFVEQLKTEGIFAKEVASSGRAFHSKFIEYAKPKLKILLDEIIPVGKTRSSRWKSTSIPESQWSSELAKTSSADYHVNNLISPVLFHEALFHVPESAVVIEIGPHSLLQAILKRSLPACSHIGLLNKTSKDLTSFLCQSIGKMFNCGLNPDLSRLYSPVEFPVSCSVPSLSSLISWDHEKSWNVPNFDPAKMVLAQNENAKNPGQTTFEISMTNEANKFYAGHKIDGRIIFPATGYLFLVWKAFSQLQNKTFDHVPVVFESVKIERATVLQENGSPVQFSITIFNTTGEFQVVEGGVAVVTGTVRSPNEDEFSKVDEVREQSKNSIPMNSEDAYKELRLRGYEYGDKFQGILNVDTLNSTAQVKWTENWVTFLDTFLQVAVLQKSTRSLMLPSFLDKTIINPQAFLQSQSADDGDSSNTVSLFYDDALTIISCKGIQFQRWKTGMAPKTTHGRISGSLKLERFQFTPYFDDKVVKNCATKNHHGDSDLDLDFETENVFNRDLCLRTCLEIILENVQDKTLKTVEIYNDQKGSNFSDSLAKSIQFQVLQQPSKLFAGKIITTKTDEHDESEKITSESGISVVIAENEKQLEDETLDADLIVVRNSIGLALNSQTNKVFSNVKMSNFLLIEHDQNCKVNIEEIEKHFGLVLVAEKSCSGSSFRLFRKKFNCQSTKNIVIEIDLTPSETQSDFNYDWVETLKQAMKLEQESTREEERRILVVSRNCAEFPSGALGLVNSLIKEPGGQNIRCFFIQNDSNLKLDFENPDEFLTARLQQDLVFNIFDSNSNVWGSYRFFPLRPANQQMDKKVEHSFLNIRTKGDLSTFQWFESPLKNYEPQSDLAKVFYAALNFRDVMLCTGKLSPDSLPNDQGLQESVLGIEFSGKTSTGNKIMGYLPTARAFATSVVPDPGFSWNVPDSWTLAEAATIPVVFSTAFYALLIRGKMRKGESILIHSGAGGVGQAAISIALSMSCRVFTTVSSTEKREFLQKKFPQLQDSAFANSRDSSFLNHILKETEGKGVDLVLNSLAGDLLQASVKCLRQHGRFLEIGKVDLFNDSKFGMAVLLKNVNISGILLDSLLSGTEQQKKLWNFMDDGIKSGVVQPLTFTTFSNSAEEIEKAFRFMATGKHKGKVLIKIHDENEESSVKTVEAFPRSYFDASKSYVVVGGLGGFGMEFCGWLVERGVRKLVIVSRSGVKNGFQDFQIRKWREVNGVEILVSTEDVTTTDGALSLLKTVISHFNSPVGGIFNLAMVLRDGFMENQTVETFQVVSRPKVNAALALDNASRQLARSLDYFVVFSSVASGQGSRGLANYAWANSASERICENRRKSGFPALAIMWGAIGDVGVLREGLKMGKDAVVGGTSAQPISSCLNTLDVLFHESKSPNSEILVSRVIAEKSAKLQTETATTLKEEKINFRDKVAHILGMKHEELENVNLNSKLYEMGMDSLMQIEIKQLFETYAGISFNPTEMKELSFGKIEEIQKRVGGKTKRGTRTEKIVSEFDGSFTAVGDLEECLKIESRNEVVVDLNSIKKTQNGQNQAELEFERENSLLCQEICSKSVTLKGVCEKSRNQSKLSQNIKVQVRGVGSYLLATFTVFMALFLSLLSLCLRQVNQLYLKLFHDPTRIKVMTRPYDQLCAAHPQKSNQIQCIKFSGVPKHSKILKKLENVTNWTTNILLENGRVTNSSEDLDSFYKPSELLSWKITTGLFFDYWEKIADFSMENHLKFKTCALTNEADLTLKKEALRLCELYHNKKWSELQPQWEVCILAPEYESNYPTDSKEFFILFVSHPCYGDGFSFQNMIQHALRDSQKEDVSIVAKPPFKNCKVDVQGEPTGFKFHQNLVEILKDYATRLQDLILELSRIDSICRGNNSNNFSSKPGSPRHCESHKFDLSALKSVESQKNGKRASVHAVVLTCASAAYQRIYKSKKNIKLPKHLVAMIPFASFDQKMLDMANNFTQSYTAVPTDIPDIQERLHQIQKSLEESSTQKKLRTCSDIIWLLSSLAKPISWIAMSFLNSPSFVFTSIPATFPKRSTYFGGHKVKEFFGYSMLVTRTHGALASAIDSENDTVNLSYVVDERALDVSPDFLELFFKYFQDELDHLIKDSAFSNQ